MAVKEGSAVQLWPSKQAEARLPGSGRTQALDRPGSAEVLSASS